MKPKKRIIFTGVVVLAAVLCAMAYASQTDQSRDTALTDPSRDTILAEKQRATEILLMSLLPFA